jgi:hypothetical protein
MSSISWSAPSAKPTRSIDWYWTAAAIAIALIIQALWSANWLFALLLLLAVISITLKHQHAPAHYDIEIRENGVVVNEAFLPYNSCASFAVRMSEHRASLVLYPTSILSGHVTLPLGGMNPDTIYASLIEHLPEHPHKETWIEVLADRLGF